MKYCPNCHATYEDADNICAKCGVALENIPAAAETADPKDHTAEFSAADISENKIIAMATYLLGFIGVIIAAILAKESPYVGFHIRQSLKIQICSILVTIITAILCWTVIVPIAGAVCSIILLVLNLIAFFQVCSGKAKEPAIISNFKFMK